MNQRARQIPLIVGSEPLWCGAMLRGFWIHTVYELDCAITGRAADLRFIQLSPLLRHGVPRTFDLTKAHANGLTLSVAGPHPLLDPLWRVDIDANTYAVEVCRDQYYP